MPAGLLKLKAERLLKAKSSLTCCERKKVITIGITKTRGYLKLGINII